MMTNEGISVADALALRNSGNEDGFGGGNAWWIIILILFMGLGWGGRGFGGGGDNGYNACCTPATQQGVTDAFNFNQLDNALRGIQNGICDGFYAMNTGMLTGFNNVQQGIANLGYNIGQGFCGVDKAILGSDFHNQAGFNAVTNQLASCCCELGRGQENIKFELAKATNDLLVANDKNTDRIINYLTQTEMDKLRTELQSAQFQLSQLSQTSNIVNQLMPVAKPAYITCSPYAAAFGINNNTCGCC
jgi:hypothetical protein